MTALKILGIDFSALFRRNWEASGGNELSEAHKRTLQKVAEIRDGYDRVALLCDGGRSFRAAMLPTYKADRERPPAPFYEQRDRTIERLTREGCSLFDAPRVLINGITESRWMVTVPPGDGTPEDFYAEADDLIASLAQWCIEKGHALTIYGNDKDLLQCVNDACNIVAWRADAKPDMLGYWWNEARVTTEIGVPPHRIAEWLALGGDRSDGFKMFPGWENGAGKHPGIGAGIAAKLLNKFGSILGVIDAIDGLDGEGLPRMKDGHVKEALRRGQPTPRDAALLGINLALLRRDLPVGFDVLLAPPVYAPLVALVPIQCARLSCKNPVAYQGAVYCGAACSATAEAERGAARMTDELHEEQVSASMFDGDNRKVSAALARADATATGMDRYALCPRNTTEALDLARWFYESRLYGQYPNEYAILAVMIEAYERGIPPGLALRNAYIVKGKSAWSASFIGALVLSSGKARRFRVIESTMTQATLEYQRTDEEEPSLFTFTIDEASKAGWLKSGAGGDGKWITNPRTMLRWAVIREGARAFFFDVVAGMHTPDELRGHTSDNDGTEDDT